jgi:hypothetical protein
MKKLIALVSCFMLTASITYAQHTTSRYGTAPNQNKTYGGLAIGQDKTLADTAGSTTDTVTIIPNSYTNHYVLTLTDSCVLSFSSIKDSWFGDNIVLTIENTSGSGHFVNFLGYSGLATKWGMSSTGTKISPASTKSATLTFFFDGVLWNEVTRSIR